MDLKIMTPTRIVTQTQTSRLRADSPHGAFTLLEHHVDFITVVTPGLLSFDLDQEELFFAVDHGVLVKLGAQVMVSVRHAVRAASLGEVHRTVVEQFSQRSERQLRTRSALMRLQADFMQKLGQS